MLYSTFQAQVRRDLEEVTANTWSDSSLMFFTNEAVKDLARKARARRDEQYADAVAGQSSYTLPVNTLSVIGCTYVTADGAYIALEREDVDTLITTNGSTPNGVPVAFAVDDEAIYLRPAPSDEGTLRFWRYCFPADIATVDDTVPFADRYATALEYSVLARCFEQIQDWESAQQYRDRHAQAIDAVMTQQMVEDSALLTSEPVEVH